MDENLINQTVEEYDVTEDINVEEIDVPTEDIEYEIHTEETVYDIAVESEDDIVIDISESMGWVSGDNRYHDSLLGVDAPNQHPITAIKNLREELDNIERLKTLYADKPNIANYYAWNEGAYNEVGYFVSLIPDTSTIEICDGSNILGVLVDNAGFIGNQDAKFPRDNTYGLVAVSGLVSVRCELEVNVGDYVISNTRGYAKRSDVNYGYRVLARENKNGVEYAIISLDVQADVINTLGKYLDGVKRQADTNSTNIVSAVNVANQAYQKVTEINTSNQVMSDKVDGALVIVDKVFSDVENLGEQVSASGMISAQARAIAESAATSAESMRNEAVAKANQALDETTKTREEFEESIDETKNSLDSLTKDLEPLSNWKSQDGTLSGYNGFVAKSNENTNELALVSGYEYKDSNGSIISKGMAGLMSQVEKNKTEIALITSFEQGDAEGVAALVEQVSDHDAQLKTLTTWQTELSTAIAGVQVTAEANEASIKDITSWQGETNTAMSLIEQKADANGAYIQSTVANMDRYAVGPYSQSHNFQLEQAKTVLTTGMVYVPTESHNELLPSNRTFTKGYYYTWDGEKWVTSTSVAVFHANTYQNGTANSPYWYIPGENNISMYDIVYNSHTLYKWESYVDVDDSTKYHWVAVATLAGNSQSRAISQIRQDTNSIALEVTDARGSASTLGARVTETESSVQTLAAWTKDDKGNQYNLATIKQTADDAGASIAQVVESVGIDGTVTAASIVAAVTEDTSSVKLLADNIILDASQIMLNGETICTAPDGNGETKIHGGSIATGTINASQIGAGTLDASIVYAGNIDASQITTGTISADLIDVDELSAITADLGTVTAGIIESNNYATDDNGSPTLGMRLNLSNGVWNSPGFKVNEVGAITAPSGNIGGFEITNNGALQYDNDDSTNNTGKIRMSSKIGEDEYLTYISSKRVGVQLQPDKFNTHYCLFEHNGVKFHDAVNNSVSEASIVFDNGLLAINCDVGSTGLLKGAWNVNGDLGVRGFNIPEMQSGQITLSRVTAGSNITVAFSKKFTGAPIVTLTYVSCKQQGVDYTNVSLTSVSATGFTFCVERAIEDGCINWIAMH